MDVRRRLPEVTAEIVRDSTIEYFIDESDSYIDGYLREIYSVPFTTAPTLIAKLRCFVGQALPTRNFHDKGILHGWFHKVPWLSIFRAWHFWFMHQPT